MVFATESAAEENPASLRSPMVHQQQQHKNTTTQRPVHEWKASRKAFNSQTSRSLVPIITQQLPIVHTPALRKSEKIRPGTAFA